MSIIYTMSVGVIGTILAFLLFLLLTFGVHIVFSSNNRNIDK